MSTNGNITPNTTIREVITKYPNTEKIFNRYGLTGCGGPKGPLEPISYFATIHQVDADALLNELNEAIKNYDQTAAQAAPTAAATAPADIFQPFLKSSILITLTIGALLGAITLASMASNGVVQNLWPAIVQAHGQAQIYGWVGLFIMGIAYHTLPRLKTTQLYGRSLAIASFWLVLIGLLLRMVAQPFSTSPFFAGWVVLSSIAELVGVSFFVFVIFKTMQHSEGKADNFDYYVGVSTVWFWLFAAATLGTSIVSTIENVDIVPAAYDLPYLHLGLMGFVTVMILGYSIRTLPLFMGLKTPNYPAFTAILYALNLGIALAVVGGFYGAITGANVSLLVAAGAAIEFVSIVAFLWNINIFRKPNPEIQEAGIDRGYERFVRAAYVWLAIAIVMALGNALYEAYFGQPISHSMVGAYRHALTVGFISMMIIGMSSRIVPVFTGVKLHSSRLLLGSFVLLNIGNATRVFSQPMADFYGGAFFASMGISGFLEVTALGLFGYNLWKTMTNKEVEELPKELETLPVETVTGPISKDMLVADVLDKYPKTLDVFASYGFDQLKNPIARKILGKQVSVEGATKIKPVDLGCLLRDLNNAEGVKKRTGADIFRENMAKITEEAYAHPEASHEATASQGPIEKDMLVSDVLAEYPKSLDVFIRNGFGPLADPAARDVVARKVTVEQVAKMKPVDLDDLMNQLNSPEVISQRVEPVQTVAESASNEEDYDEPEVEGPVKKDMTAAEVIAKYPQTLDVFVSYGFDHLKDKDRRETMGKLVTVEEAAKIHNKDLKAFLTELNKAATNPVLEKTASKG